MHVAGATPLPGRSTRMIAAAYTAVYMFDRPISARETLTRKTPTRKK